MKRTIPKNAAAKAAIDFVENLTLVGGDSGEPVKLLPFQKEILSVIFGLLDAKNKRKVNRVFLMLPRKQAKTFLAACIVLYWLVGRGLKGQQCFSVANDKEQASEIFNTLAQIIEADPELNAATGGPCEITRSTKHVSIPATYSFYAALSKESKTKTGKNSALVIIDEGQDITDSELIKNITTGRTAQAEPLTLFIGTAGTRKDTPFYAEYEYAKKWLAGTVKNENYYAWIYEANEEDDWTSEAVWKRVMPAYGKFCRVSEVKKEFKLAQDMPHKEREFKQYQLNLWQMYGGVSWLDDAEWMYTENARAPLGDAAEYYAGFDKASVLDTTSLCLFGLNSQGFWDVIPFIWCCAKQVDDRITADFSYRAWAKQGYLRVTDGSAQNEIRIADDISGIIKQYKVKMFSIDPNGTSYISARLEDFGYIPGSTLVAFSQAIKSMSEPIKEITKLVKEKKLYHGGNPVLRWMVNNVKLLEDGKGNWGFSKKVSTEKIDACTALACAVGVAIPAIAQASVGLGRSVYETRGVIVL